MNQEHKQQRVFGYGPVRDVTFHNRIIRGREFKLTIKTWNEERQAYDEEDFFPGKLLPGFESKTTHKTTRHQRRAKTGKPILVFKQVYRDRNKYLPNGRLKETV